MTKEQYNYLRSDSAISPLEQKKILHFQFEFKKKLQDIGLQQIFSSKPCIDLKSQKINDSWIEQFTSQLDPRKQIKLDSIDLSNNQITAKGVKILAQYVSTSVLNLSNNPIGDNGAQFITRILSSNTKYLNASDCNLGNDGIQEIMESLNAPTNNTSFWSRLFVNTPIEMTINLSKNHLSGTGIAAFVHDILRLNEPKAVEITVDLSHNNLALDDIKYAAEKMKDSVNYKLSSQSQGGTQKEVISLQQPEQQELEHDEYQYDAQIKFIDQGLLGDISQ